MSLTYRGRLLRVVATLIGAALLLAGTAVGSDDHFPFGPFKMYSTTDDPNAPVADTRLEAVDTGRTRRVLTQQDTGIRRAEIEGQLDRFKADPTLLATVAEAYEQRRPGAPELVAVAVVIRWHELRGGRPTRGYRDETVAVWRR